MFFKLFVILLLYFQCYFCFPWVDPTFGDINLSGMVTIFAQCPENSDCNDKISKYQCQGYVIHPSIVLTIADCVPEKKYKKLVEVRVYDWEKYPDVKNETPFIERNLAKIIHHPFYNNSAGESNIYNLVVLILEKPIHLAAVIELPELGRNYSNDCTLIHLKGDMTKGLSEQRYFTGIINESHCFDLINAAESKNRHNTHKNVLCAASEKIFPCGLFAVLERMWHIIDISWVITLREDNSTCTCKSIHALSPRPFS
ncbi:uncharacterized protein [Chelonus insularis]|uniref:uncharacterized protein isoform X2 n=1 Tax=Chelonus insularis TaxID=460826 RepID=UPI00158BCFC4|nr:uncharacterized protein LOC118067693 isoform X2 [Chelonus insularis]